MRHHGHLVCLGFQVEGLLSNILRRSKTEPKNFGWGLSKDSINNQLCRKTKYIDNRPDIYRYRNRCAASANTNRSTRILRYGLTPNLNVILYLQPLLLFFLFILRYLGLQKKREEFFPDRKDLARMVVLKKSAERDILGDNFFPRYRCTSYGVTSAP